jgi:Replication protein
MYRAETFALRDGLRQHAPRPGDRGSRVGACGRVRVGGDVAAVLRGDRCHYCGLVRCGSIWSCPCCSAQIRAERAGDVQHVVQWHVDQLGAQGAYLLTLTVRHRYGDALADLRGGITRAYSKRFANGADWKRFLGRVGYTGSIRALEVTHGGNGWHPHLHVILLVRNGAALERELVWLTEQWQRAVKAELGPAAEPDVVHAVDLRPCMRADYLAKLGLEARNGNRTPWEIAADLVERGEEEDRHLWRTWCEDMRGARMLTWSRGLRTAAGLEEKEKDDQEIVEGEGANDKEVCRVPGAVWDRIRNWPGVPAQLLAIAETEGAEGVARYLERLGFEHGPEG